MAREINAKIDALFVEGPDDGRYGIWMWPNNVSHGALETFVADLLRPSSVLDYAAEACRIARELHGAEYDPGDDRKATLKVRSVWRDARAAVLSVDPTGSTTACIQRTPLPVTACNPEA